MESSSLIGAEVFIPLVIVAVTQIIKKNAPKVKGNWTVVTALVVGLVIALIDGFIGVTDVSIAQGIFFAVGAVGIVSAAKNANGE